MAVRLPPVGFWSYARQDDELSFGRLSSLRAILRSELQQQYGRESISLFQDVAAIPPGAEWEAEIHNALGRSTFFIPIITPNFIQSEWCTREVEIFLERELALKAEYDGLKGERRIFPIYYIDAESEPHSPAILAELRKLQWFDFRKLRFKDQREEEVQVALSGLASSVRHLLHIPLTSADDRRPDDPKSSLPAEAGAPATDTIRRTTRDGDVPRAASASDQVPVGGDHSPVAAAKPPTVTRATEPTRATSQPAPLKAATTKVENQAKKTPHEPDGRPGHISERAIEAQPITQYQTYSVFICGITIFVLSYCCAEFDNYSQGIGYYYNISYSIRYLLTRSAPLAVVIGALLSGPAADLRGRKLALSGALLIGGFANLAEVFANSSLVAYASGFVMRAALVAATVSALTLAIEYTPHRRKLLFGTLVLSPVSFSSVLVGAFPLTPHLIFLVGGGLCLALFALVITRLSDSLPFLESAGRKPEWIKAASRSLSVEPAAAEETAARLPGAPAEIHPFREILSRGFGRATLLLWLVGFFGSAASGLLTLGVAESPAGIPSRLFFSFVAPAGVMLALVISTALDRRRTRVGVWLGTALVLGGLLGALVATAGYTQFVVVLVGGAALTFVAAPQTVYKVLAGTIYPVRFRATGIATFASSAALGAVLAGLIAHSLYSTGLWLITAGVFAVLAGGAAFAAQRVRAFQDAAIGPSVSSDTP